jgi:hypothetical protein
VPAKRDTISVNANSYAVIRFKADNCWFSSMIPLIYSEECLDIYSNPGAIKALESHDRMKDKPTKSKYTTPV